MHSGVPAETTQHSKYVLRVKGLLPLASNNKELYPLNNSLWKKMDGG
jgi:hypothetical protein